jgi:predicted ATPase
MTGAAPPSGDVPTPPTLATPSPCRCTAKHSPRLIVVTGGPGAGKTAVLELVRRSFCEHVLVLPEAAGILFSGGFPRRDSSAARRAAQVAIFHVQRSLESMALAESNAALILCDRGTLDGLAYWPSEPGSYCDAVGTTKALELGRYDAVLHLRTPELENGYHQLNPLRIESASQAQAIDTRIVDAWAGHPRRTFISATPDFMVKAARAVAAVLAELPSCCARRPSPSQSPTVRSDP